MFDSERYYAAAKSGDVVNSAQLIQYINGFDQVILWGASYLGKAIGNYLLKSGVSISTYWDLRFDQLGSVLGIPVIQPFTGKIDKSNTLIILCIGNVILQPMLKNKLETEQYTYLMGDYLYMGAICPANNENGILPSICMRSMICRFIYCERLSNIVKNSCSPNHFHNPESNLFLHSITVVINSTCSLSCKYCTSYMQMYPAAKRVNFALNRITEDIDRFFSAVDGVGTVTVMGGEPFLHPDISVIVEALLDKPNCGVISIATSGTCKIRKEQLSSMKNDRVNVSFSNYLECLNEVQKQFFHENVELMSSMGIPYTVGVDMPQWIVPSTLNDKHMSNPALIAKKNGCTSPPRTIQIKNGRIHPCDFANAVYSLNVADYRNSYVDIEQSLSAHELRQNIMGFMEAPYYSVCGHCMFTGDSTSKAGEQGIHNFLASTQQ